MIERPLAPEEPKVSVVIPTIPDNDHSSVVNKLKEQNFSRSFEIIVVNNNLLNICEARNKGIEESNSTIVCLTDDDCNPPTDWIQSVHSCFQQNEEIVAVEGPVTGGINYSGTRRYVGCNLAFKREDALDTMFDSTFAGWRDDTEFGWRMEDQGECQYNPNMLMNHPPRPGSGYIAENEEKLRNRHPEKYKEVFIQDTPFLDRVHRNLNKLGAIEFLNRIRYDR
jgi:GT2 family glycosyltransferase